ncbi:MAG TPA: IPT/TIG domain-containing protein [Acidimicrobiales bacterium]|jgi:hypothetical protein|nr:IPT/TIG domain-containing protein [Acidimicrobiales bacterium]
MLFTRIKQSLLAAVMATAAVAGTSAFLSAPLQAATIPDTGSGSAYGLQVLLAGSALVPPTPSVTLPAGGSDFPGVSSTTIALPLLPLVTVNVANAQSWSSKYGTPGEEVDGTAGVVGSATIAGINLLSALNIQSVTTACASNAGGSTGTTTILDLAGNPIVGSTLPIPPALNLLVAAISINKQTQVDTHATPTTAGTASMDVIGLQIQLLPGVLPLNSSLVEVDLAHSACAVTGSDIEAPPTVTSVTPAGGPPAGGTTVTITGSGFTHASAVKFGTTAAKSFTINSDGSITAVSPAGTGVVDVTVTNPFGTSATSAADKFTYGTPPTISAGGISPTSGTDKGGTPVTIMGTGFLTPSAVSFGGVAATGVTVVSPTEITAVTPPHPDGTVDVAVSDVNGTATATNAFTFTAVPAPTINVNGITPLFGPLAGGTTVTIMGTNLTGTSEVDFGANKATGVTVVNSGEVTAITPPALAPGPVSVSLTTPGGSVTAAQKFTYEPIPTINALSGISPLFGPTAGGTTVTITGTGFDPSYPTAVSFGGVASPTVTVLSTTTVTAVTPPHVAGSVSVALADAGSVNLPGGAVTATQLFTYVPPPTIAVTGISPVSGPITGGTFVTITGTGFAGPVSVTFGGIAGSSPTVVNSTTVTVITPPHAVGAVPVVLTDAGGTIQATQSFLYQSDIVNVSGISPAFGPLAGGTVVTITGSGFDGTSTVTFGGKPATISGTTTATTITATSPPGTVAGPVDVVVTTGANFSPSVVQDQFTYVGAPVIAATGLNPTSGPTSGGTLVTITGSGFAGPTAVSFGGVAATDVIVVSPTEVTAIDPSHAAGAVAVALADLGGTVTAPQPFTYVVGPSVVGISPTSGPQQGGETVIIGGANLCNATSVDFGGVNAPIKNISTDCTTITVTEPPGDGTVHVTVHTPSGDAVSPVDFTYIQPGYWEAAADGGVFSFGGAVFHGSVPGVLKPGQHLNSPIVAMADTPDHGGYWLFAADGGVFAFGDAQFFGSVPGVLKPHQVLNGPIVAAEATPDGHGYREFAADGGVFDFGNAQFTGSLPGEDITPASPITGAISTPIGQGYWLADAAGGIFDFGNAANVGTAEGAIFGRVVAAASTPTGKGLYLFLAGGQVGVLGDATSGLGGGGASAPVVFGEDTSTGQGYWEFTGNGQVFSFGDAPALGSAANIPLNAPITAGIAFGSD